MGKKIAKKEKMNKKRKNDFKSLKNEEKIGKNATKHEK